MTRTDSKALPIRATVSEWVEPTQPDQKRQVLPIRIVDFDDAKEELDLTDLSMEDVLARLNDYAESNEDRYYERCRVAARSMRLLLEVVADEKVDDDTIVSELLTQIEQLQEAHVPIPFPRSDEQAARLIHTVRPKGDQDFQPFRKLRWGMLSIARPM